MFINRQTNPHYQKHNLLWQVGNNLSEETTQGTEWNNHLWLMFFWHYCRVWKWFFSQQWTYLTVYTTGGIIWEVEGRGSGSKGVAYQTDSPTQVEDRVFDLGRWVCMICYPLTTTPPTFHLPNNTACGIYTILSLIPFTTHQEIHAWNAVPSNSAVCDKTLHFIHPFVIELHSICGIKPRLELEIKSYVNG